MAKHLALLFLGIPAICAGMPGSAGEPLTPGETRTVELADKDHAKLAVEAAGTVRIAVHNLDRDTILSVRNAAGRRVLRAAGWRGPEHYYVAIADADSPLALLVEPDDPISPPGRFRIRIDVLSEDAPLLAAERVMTQATDLNLAYYFGEADNRREARHLYLQAAELFSGIGDRPRQADALFEAANVSDALCDRDSALQQLVTAGAIWSDLGDQRGAAATENLRGLVHWQVGEHRLAMALFESAADRREQLGQPGSADEYFYAEAINNLGLVHRETGDARLARLYFREALRIWQGSVDLLTVDSDDSSWTSADRPPWLHHSLTAMNNLAWANEVFGDIEESERIWLQALKLSRHRSIGDMGARLQNNLGNLKRRTGNMLEAMELLEQSLLYFSDTSPDEYWVGLVHFNIAQVHKDLGNVTRALESLERSLELRTQECDPVGRAETLHEIAEIRLEKGDVSGALDYISDAEVLLAPFNGNELANAALINLAGRAYFSLRRYAEALKYYDRAVALYRGAGYRLGEAKARTDRAVVSQRLGRELATVTELKAALDIAEQIDAPLEQFRILTHLGAAYLGDNMPDTALHYARLAIDLSESLRRQLVRPILLRDFTSVQRRAFDVYIQAYIELGLIEQAWLAAEESRARRFTDVIRQSGFDIRALDTEQTKRYQLLIEAIALRVETRTELLSRNDTQSAAIVLRDLLPLLDEVDLLQELGRSSSAAAATPISLELVRAGLQSGDVLLEYYLGERVAGVWSITDDHISYRPLGAVDNIGSDIETTLRAIRGLQSPESGIMERVSRTLLGQEDVLRESQVHLVVIPDGPLHYLPFALLPDPASGYQDPLVERRTVTYLPSMRSLIDLRDRVSVASEGIAVVADPVFQIDDPRNKSAAHATIEQLVSLDPELNRGSEGGGVDAFPRLLGSLEEANAIRAAAGDVKVRVFQGTEANKEVVIAGELNGYRILHFATHGIVDDDEPALSGLVLSGVTETGAVRSRFLRSQDIAALDLNARLVVLSGCETGLGRLAHGEGLLGLSRAFFYAGASQVISTLWQIPDQATAELMGHFYRAMLRENASAPAALRQAQLAMRQQVKWRETFYWAPFIIQGDWN